MAGGVQNSGGGGSDGGDGASDGGDGHHGLAKEKPDFRLDMVAQLEKGPAEFHQGDSQELHGFAAKVEEDAFSGDYIRGHYMKNIFENSSEKEHLQTQMGRQICLPNELQDLSYCATAMWQAEKVSNPEDIKEEIFQQIKLWKDAYLLKFMESYRHYVACLYEPYLVIYGSCIKQWKDDYLLDLKELDRDYVAPTLTEKHTLSLSREDLNKYNKRTETKKKITDTLEFLQLQRSDVTEDLNGKLPMYEMFIEDLSDLIRKNKAKNPKANTRPQSQLQMVNISGSAASFPADKGRQQQQQDQPADANPSFPINSPEDQVPCEGPETLVAKKPFTRLLDAMRALSPAARREAVHSVWSVVRENDSVPLGGIGAFPGWTYTEQQGGSRVLNKMKRIFEHSSSPPESAEFGSMDGCCMAFECDALDSESSSEHRAKRQKIQIAKDALREEIKAISRKLIDTVISIPGDNQMDGITSGDDGGTMIKFSYIAVSLSPDLKSHFAESGMPIVMPLELFVPADYPRSSPVLIDDKGDDDQPRKKLSVILDSVDPAFRLAIRKLPEPWSIKEIVIQWDACVREAVIEFARQHGGGTFSSTYGRWETYRVDP